MIRQLEERDFLICTSHPMSTKACKGSSGLCLGLHTVNCGLSSNYSGLGPIPILEQFFPLDYHAPYCMSGVFIELVISS